MMIPVYVISLADSARRRAAIIAQFDSLGIPFDFSDAVAGRSLSKHERETAAPKGGIHYCGMLTPEEIGCAASHLNVIRRIAAGESEYALVIEDDVRISPTALPFLNSSYLRSLPKFDLLQMDGSHPKKTRLTLRVGLVDGFELCALTKCHHSMYALIYTREAARKISASTRNITAPIDNMIFKDFQVCGLRIVAVRPSVITHIGLPTVIGDRPMLQGLPKKTEREIRRLISWLRRWYSFAQAWGLSGILGLRLRRAE